MMSEQTGRITWDKAAEEKFLVILKQIPDMIRGIAENRVNNKAQAIVREDNRQLIEEKDMVAAFFAETPPAFKNAMVKSMDELEIDYKGYGYG
jgi:hypothetical protein